MMNSQIPRLRVLVASLALWVSAESRSDEARGAGRGAAREWAEARSSEDEVRAVKRRGGSGPNRGAVR
jgi:hypothetical protein